MRKEGRELEKKNMFFNSPFLTHLGQPLRQLRQPRLRGSGNAEVVQHTWYRNKGERWKSKLASW